MSCQVAANTGGLSTRVQNQQEEKWEKRKKHYAVKDIKAKTNCVDPDQTAPEGAVWSVSSLIANQAFCDSKTQCPKFS